MIILNWTKNDKNSVGKCILFKKVGRQKIKVNVYSSNSIKI